MIGIVRDPIFLEHDMGFYHPESPERLRSIYSMLDRREKDWSGRFTYIPVREATREELERIHDPAYIDKIADTAGKSHVYLDPDTSTSPKSYEAALKAAGSFVDLAFKVFKGELDAGFAFVRPPGHHAERDRAMGFCIFNNVAVAAASLVDGGAEKVLIVDWDLHHGNGTQHAFYGTNRVLYFSSHQFPYYPGTGSMEEIGVGEGTGYTVNLPLSPGCGDAEYVYLYSSILAPIVEQYRPDIVLVSAGFDPYYKDPLGGMDVTEEGFAALAQIILDAAKKVCGGKVAITLEGGYNVGGLTKSCEKVLEVLLGDYMVGEDRMKVLFEKGKESKGGFFEKIRKNLEGFWEL